MVLVEGTSSGLAPPPLVRTPQLTNVQIPHLNVSNSERRRWRQRPPFLARLTNDVGELRTRLKTAWQTNFGRDPLERANLFEGDILPLTEHGSTKGEAQEKNAVKETTKLWANAVLFYKFSSEFVLLPLERYIIRQVMDDIASRSCVRFVERTSQPDYVKIIYDGPRCYSHIGRVGGAQVMSLGAFCVLWWDRGPIYHELLHALGFFHEHNRPDRDKFVEIKWNNIAEGEVENFIKRSRSIVDLTDLPYDINSVMHYSPFAFGKWYFLTPTIKSREKGYNFWRSTEPSKIDYRKLNRLYKCRRDGRFLHPLRGSSRLPLSLLQMNGVDTSSWSSRRPSTRYALRQLPGSRVDTPITRHLHQVTPAWLRLMMNETLPPYQQRLMVNKSLPQYQQKKQLNHNSFPSSLARPTQPSLPIRYIKQTTSTERPERLARLMGSASQLKSIRTRLGPSIRARWQPIPNMIQGSSRTSHPNGAG
ncbi:astacin-like metalloprotease toxin 2 isoform X4 [Panulirus ornatus]